MQRYEKKVKEAKIYIYNLWYDYIFICIFAHMKLITTSLNTQGYERKQTIDE